MKSICSITWIVLKLHFISPTLPMNKNEEILNSFYTAFQNRDYQSMQQYYADNAIFNDEVFRNLNAGQVKAMWEMLIKRGRDLQIEFRNVMATDTTGSVGWTARYTFSQTRRPVVNHILATFEFENGKIIRHTDTFDFYRWARQALGINGLLLGWTPFLKTKVKKTAMGSLDKFMAAKQAGS